jgi:hypothetical protein
MSFRAAVAALLLGCAGCGDKCEVLCQQVGNELATCKPASLTWNNLGARSRAHFVSQCRTQWGRERLDLTASDLRLALQACRDTTQALDDLSCEEIVALYAPED